MIMVRKNMTKILIAMFTALLLHQVSVQGDEPSELDKAIVRYEQRFQISFPVCSDYTESEKLNLIKKALDADVVYLTKEEDAKLKESLREEYQKKSARPITDFERVIARNELENIINRNNTYFMENKDVKIKELLSVEYQKKVITPIKLELTLARVHFMTMQLESRIHNEDDIDISITRTAVGAIVKIVTDRDTLKNELNMREWVDIISAMRRYRINEWELWQRKTYDSLNNTDAVLKRNKYWMIELFFLDKNERCVGDIDKLVIEHIDDDLLPPNWVLLRWLMDKTAAKAKRSPKQQRNKNIESK
jgi:hypothetical protein